MKKHWLSLLCLVGILFAFTAKLHADGTYLVIDLETWQYRYTDTAPDLDDDTCRTTELWLRYIPAGTFTMGSPEDELGGHKWSLNEPLHKVTLTKPFYIGVFECTQAQWEYVMGEGNRPSYFNNNDCYATRPVEQIYYGMVRGWGAGAGWPENGHAVDETSFMGVLRDKTGLMFDLPTEAQWEYACRAGTETALNSGKNLENVIEDANMAEVGRYYYNSFSPSQGGYTLEGTAKVGSYLPNNWGLYDMHGNVWEWCLDLFDNVIQRSADDATDPVGNATGRYHVLRGGGWYSSARLCRSASRYFYEQSYNYYENIGFRILCLPPYAVTVVNGTADKAEAAEGETVTITADEPPFGKVFDCWTGSVLVANANATEATFEMPANAVTITANYMSEGTRYLVINLETWQYRYTDNKPNLDNDTCRTTELWLRQIPAGTFMMGSPEDELGRSNREVQHKVTLTKPFYIGVFECTQEQWEHVMGDRPSNFNNNDYYATRPVEAISFDMIRGADTGAGWPENGHAVDASSFMGKLQAKTGLVFDLPTEAQWEYACRAGTTTSLNSGKNVEHELEEDANMAEVGRYIHNGGEEGWEDSNCDTTYGTAKVGSYLPNNWGLYDMHGNMAEYCLDWWDGSTAYSSSAVTDPVGDTTGTYRVVRGGGVDLGHGGALDCRSARRRYNRPSYRSLHGFRVVFLPPETYAVTVVKGTADKSEAAAGETVAITANMPASGQTFDKWTGDVEFANETAPETTFEMPAKAVTVTATFKKIPGVKTYKIVVVNGTADKAKAAAGETVTLTAKPAPAGKVFDRWTGGAVFADPNAMETTFEMPAKAVTPKAIYKKK